MIIETEGSFVNPGLLTAFLLQCTSSSAKHTGNSGKQANRLNLMKVLSSLKNVMPKMENVMRKWK